MTENAEIRDNTDVHRHTRAHTSRNRANRLYMQETGMNVRQARPTPEIIKTYSETRHKFRSERSCILRGYIKLISTDFKNEVTYSTLFQTVIFSRNFNVTVSHNRA